MRREDISKELASASFEYFYWISRFEFALKENKFLKSTEPNTKAEPSWKAFIEIFKAHYIASKEAVRLIELHPKSQLISENRELIWKPVGIAHCNNDLCKVVTMLNSVRNNLFHGGKHGDADIDSKARNLELLHISKAILDQLVILAGFEADYTRYY